MRVSEGQKIMKIYVDIDNTICSQVVGDYGKVEPWFAITL